MAAHLDASLLDRLYQRSGAERWAVPRADFTAALERSVAQRFKGASATSRDMAAFCEALHLADLSLACACACGNEEAWDHFMREQRPLLYRAADAMDPTGRARESADALYAELWGVRKEGPRQSLFRYYHGRSSLTTWLRAVLAQRHVDRIRADRRTEPLPDEEMPAATMAVDPDRDPDRARWLRLANEALGAAVTALPARDRLRLGCYYAQDMTLAAIGRLLGEHEATVSRHLARTRRVLRESMERYLRDEHRLGDADIDECFTSASGDSGGIDLGKVLMRRTQERTG